jgi:hypothetical protein
MFFENLLKKFNFHLNLARIASTQVYLNNGPV